MERFGTQAAMNVYPPYAAAGVMIDYISDDYSEIRVSMNLHPLNKNYVGTHFGGSLYSMCDPFYMLILMRRLGNTYIVWDKSATIDFLRPGTGTVSAKFQVSDQEIAYIKDQVAEKKKIDHVFETQITAEDGSVVARLKKVLYVRAMPR